MKIQCQVCRNFFDDKDIVVTTSQVMQGILVPTVVTDLYFRCQTCYDNRPRFMTKWGLFKVQVNKEAKK